MRFSLEKISKYLLLLALTSLVFRISSLTVHGLPNPFEILFVITFFITAVDIIKNNKISEFRNSLSRSTRLAFILLIFFIVLGGAISVFIKGIPISSNMVMEFGTFLVSVGLFTLIVFHTRNDESFKKKCLFALVIPVFFIIFIPFPKVAHYFNFIETLEGSGFQGLTLNVNIFSKMMLIPTLFFIAHSLLEDENKLRKILYIFISSASVTLLFWSTERAGLFALGVSTLVIWLVYSFNNFSWKKLLYSAVIVLFIVALGFTMMPHSGKKLTLDRMLYPDNKQLSYDTIKHQTASQVLLNSINSNTNVLSSFLNKSHPVDSRAEIWPFYLKYAVKNPMGIGPNTHVETKIEYENHTFISPGPHSSYIEILIWGGVFGLFSFVYIMWSAFLNLKRRLKVSFSPIVLATLGSLVALSAAIMFNDNIQSYWFWAVLALSFGI